MGADADCRAADAGKRAGCVPFELALTDGYEPSCAAACRVWWRAVNRTAGEGGCPVVVGGGEAASSMSMAAVARGVFGDGLEVKEEEAAALAACEARWCGAAARERRQREQRERGVDAAVAVWDWPYVNCLERELYADRGACGMAAACGGLGGGGGEHKRHWLSLAGANSSSSSVGAGGGKQRKGGKAQQPQQPQRPAAAVLKPEQASLRAEEEQGRPPQLSSAAVALAFAGGMGAAVVALGMAYLVRWGLAGMGVGVGSSADRGNAAAGHHQRSSSVIRV